QNHSHSGRAAVRDRHRRHRRGSSFAHAGSEAFVTTRGRTLLVLALVMFGFGRIAGMRELIMMGTGLGVVLAVGAAAIWIRRGTVTVTRSVRPAVTVADRPVRVELSVRASGHLGTGPVLLTDEIPPRVGNSVR